MRLPLRVIGTAAACACLAFALASGAAGAHELSPQSHEGVHLYTPANGGGFTTTDTIKFTWYSTWFNQSAASTLHFFIGTSLSDTDNLVHEHWTCPASSAPSCQTEVSYFNFQPGTYYWGVQHEFPGPQIKNSDIWSFTVTADQHVRISSPRDGATFSTIEDVNLVWETDWSGPASTLHVFVGTGGATDNVVHVHYTCPAGSAPTCPTSRAIGKLPAGSYVWGVDHEFPGLSLRKSPRWSFTVVEPRVNLTPRAPPRLPIAPPRATKSRVGGVAVVRNTLNYRGGSGPNVVDVVKVGRWFVLTQDGGRLQVGRGCRRVDARSARCSTKGVRTFFAAMGGGNDSVAATIPLPSTLLGGAGADRLEGSTRGDVLDGGPDHDTVEGGGGGDRVYGEGTDVLLGDAGDDAIFARTNQEGTAEGGDGNDYLVGGPENTVLTGGEGDDYLDGSGGNDLLLGGAGTDVLVGGDGGDTLRGDAKDEVSAGPGLSSGVDLMYCGPGGDLIDGLDPTQQIDFSCEHAQTSFVGGLCGCYRPGVVPRLHRVSGARPYVELYVASPKKLEVFKVKISFLGAGGRTVAPDATVTVPGLRWVSLRQIKLPKTVRRAVAVVVE
jgi:hypothetical protein